MPTNLYGPGDNFHPEHSHVVPALIRRFHEAAEEDRDVVQVWGSGRPRREFMYVDDMADGALFVADLPRARYAEVTEPMLSHINVGTGTEVSIAELATMIAGVTGFRGEIRFDPTRPDGTPRKLMDTSKLRRLGWEARVPLREGLDRAYAWFLAHREELRGRAGSGPE